VEGVHLKLNYKGLNFLSNISLIPGTVFETIVNIKVKAFSGRIIHVLSLVTHVTVIRTPPNSFGIFVFVINAAF